jgi:hypothetical protein
MLAWAPLDVCANGFLPRKDNGNFNFPQQPQFNFNPPAQNFNFPAPQVPLGSVRAKLVVAVDENAKNPRLQISQALLQQAAPGAGDARPGRVGLPVMFGGLALSLCFVSWGFWLLRSRNGRRLTAFLLAGSMLTFGASVLWANLGPPPRPEPPVLVKNQVKLPSGLQLTEDLTIEIFPAGAVPVGSIVLVVPKESVIKQDKAAPEE